MHQQAGMHSNRVIVVDHDESTTELIADLLKSEGLAPLCCSASLLSVDCIEQMQANLIILDLSLGEPSAALDLIGELRRNPPTRALPVIVNSTNDRLLERLAEPLRDLGCIALAKPFELDDFFVAIQVCLDAGRPQTQFLAC
jgi:CheY-like chemotaxis protein